MYRAGFLNSYYDDEENDDCENDENSSTQFLSLKKSKICQDEKENNLPQSTQISGDISQKCSINELQNLTQEKKVVKAFPTQFGKDIFKEAIRKLHLEPQFAKFPSKMTKINEALRFQRKKELKNDK